MLIDSAKKTMTLEQAIPWCEQFRITGKRLVALENAEAEFRFIPFVEGFSFIAIISKIRPAGSC